MPLIATTIRWDSVAYEFIKDEARDASVPVAQFVREAALIRASLRAAQRDAPEAMPWKLIAAEVERLAAIRKAP